MYKALKLEKTEDFDIRFQTMTDGFLGDHCYVDKEDADGEHDKFPLRHLRQCAESLVDIKPVSQWPECCANTFSRYNLIHSTVHAQAMIMETFGYKVMDKGACRCYLDKLMGRFKQMNGKWTFTEIEFMRSGVQEEHHSVFLDLLHSHVPVNYLARYQGHIRHIIEKHGKGARE